jgi:hypothetical protein
MGDGIFKRLTLTEEVSDADWQSAIQQAGSLRYVIFHFAPTDYFHRAIEFYRFAAN